MEHLLRLLPVAITIIIAVASVISQLSRAAKVANRPPGSTPLATGAAPPPRIAPPAAPPAAPSRVPVPPPRPFSSPPQAFVVTGAPVEVSQEQAVTDLFLTPKALAAAMVAAEVLGPPLSLRER
jgi:hypothetical protein